MKIIDQRFALLIIYLTTIACSKNNDQWKHGAITKEGEYQATDMKIVVRIENDLVNFKGFDYAGRSLLQNPHAISALHRWALYLDKDGSLWVLSSDIGDSIFKKDSITGMYKYSQFNHYLKKNDVPNYLYDDLKSFVSFR
jgi:hypothetical protein